MIIDSHNHVGYITKDADAVIREMDELGIAQCWLLTWYLTPGDNSPSYHRSTSPVYFRSDGTHGAIPLAPLLAARDRHPDRFVVGYCPAPTEGDAAAHFEAAWKIHGVRICGEWSYRLPLDDPRAIELFRVAGRLGAPVILHMDVPWLPAQKDGPMVYQQHWYGGTVANLERAMLACPDTIFVGHGPGFWREISADADREPSPYPNGPVVPGGRLLPLLERYPNLWADLSAGSGLNGIRRSPEVGLALIQRFQDRLLFGRDQYGDALRQYLLSLNLPADLLAKLFHGNAQRLLSLGSPG
jgi:predicted TIM-barrel fold metal-dependent hydrolase